jgi:hypothetical protein
MDGHLSAFNTVGIACVSPLLAAAYSHAALRENVMSIVTKLEYCGIAFGWNDQSLSYKLIKNGPFVPLQICAGSIQLSCSARSSASLVTVACVAYQ